MAYDKKQMVAGDKIIEYTNDFEDRVDSGFGGTDTEIEALKQKDIALEEKIDLRADYVVDYGSNANGNWEKWDSGKLVQWGKTKEMITSISTSGNNYLFNNYEELTFPIPFIDVPEQILNGAVRTISVVWSLTRNVTNTKIEILLMGAMNSSSGVGYYKAIGRWK